LGVDPSSFSPQRGEGLRMRGGHYHTRVGYVVDALIPDHPSPGPLPVKGRGSTIGRDWVYHVVE